MNNSDRTPQTHIDRYSSAVCAFSGDKHLIKYWMGRLNNKQKEIVIDLLMWYTWLHINSAIHFLLLESYRMCLLINRSKHFWNGPRKKHEKNATTQEKSVNQWSEHFINRGKAMFESKLLLHAVIDDFVN